MSQPTIHVTIVDAAGTQQIFEVGRVDLDCGSGCIDIRPGKPAFCRGFDRGVLTLDNGTEVTTLIIVNGMASLTGDTVSVICESATMDKLAWGEGPIAPAVSQGLRDKEQSEIGSPLQSRVPPARNLSPMANAIPVQPTGTKETKPQTASYII